MGEIAEMMLDGTLCQYCGVYLDQQDPCWFPMSCSDCECEEENKLENKKPRISAAERKIRKRTLEIIRQNLKINMQASFGGKSYWEFFLNTRFMNYIRETRNSEDFKKIVINSVKEWAEINEIDI